jgi:hypothetical protein
MLYPQSPYFPSIPWNIYFIAPSFQVVRRHRAEGLCVCLVGALAEFVEQNRSMYSTSLPHMIMLTPQNDM